MRFGISERVRIADKEMERIEKKRQVRCLRGLSMSLTTADMIRTITMGKSFSGITFRGCSEWLLTLYGSDKNQKQPCSTLSDSGLLSTTGCFP